MNEIYKDSNSGMMFIGVNRSNPIKPLPVLFRSTQTPHGVARIRTWPSTIRGHRSTDSAMTRQNGSNKMCEIHM